jgi:Mn2+/Fe2+ NRAMP family transporter
MDTTWKEARVFYGLMAVTIGLSCIFTLLPFVSLFQIMIFAQVVNGMLLPIILIFLVLLLRKGKILGLPEQSRAGKFKDVRKAQAAMLSFEHTTIVSVTGSQDAVETLTKDAGEIEKKEKENKLQSERYYKLKMRLATVAEVLALLATGLLFFASILITQTFIWD